MCKELQQQPSREEIQPAANLSEFENKFSYTFKTIITMKESPKKSFAIIICQFHNVFTIDE